MTKKRVILLALLIFSLVPFVSSVPAVLANGAPDNFVPSAIQVQTAGIENPLFLNVPVIASSLALLLIFSGMLLYNNNLSLPLIKYRPRKDTKAAQIALPLSPLAALPEAEEPAKA